jgi:hypothetical protein
MLVVTSCTGSKAVSCAAPLTLDDFREPARLARREHDLALQEVVRPAAEMYTGRQHLHVLDGVRTLRQRFGQTSVALGILSAGYGLLAESRPIAPYDASFNDMTRSEARAWARQLQVPEMTRGAMHGFPLVVFLLGSRYLDAIEPPIPPEAGQRIVYFAKPGEMARLLQHGVTVVHAGKPQATVYGEGLVALKGWMFALLARSLTRSGDALLDALCADDTAATIEQALRAASRDDVPAR